MFTFSIISRLMLRNSILMAQCKTAITPVLTHWSYSSLALKHRYAECCNCLNSFPTDGQTVTPVEFQALQRQLEERDAQRDDLLYKIKVSHRWKYKYMFSWNDVIFQASMYLDIITWLTFKILHFSLQTDMSLKISTCPTGSFTCLGPPSCGICWDQPFHLVRQPFTFTQRTVLFLNRIGVLKVHKLPVSVCQPFL